MQNFENSYSADTNSPSPIAESPPPEPEIDFVDRQTTGSGIPPAADAPYESVSSVVLECKSEVQRVCFDRKLIVIRASDMRRSRSADIFRPCDAVDATSGLATARAQSETRDVTTDSWDALVKTQQTFALGALSSRVRYNKFTPHRMHNIDAVCY